MYRAVSQAGVMLAEAPARQLASAPLQPLETDPNSPLPGILTKIINASISPITEPGDTPALPGGAQSRSVCADAEMYFKPIVIDLLRQDSLFRRFHRLHRPGYQIVVDGLGQAVAIRKAKGANSTLTLTEMIIGGIPYPEGSLISTEFPVDTYLSNGYCEYQVPYGERSKIALNGVTRAAFLRLSYLAVPPWLRLKDFKLGFEPESTFGVNFRRLMVRSVSMERLQKAATFVASQTDWLPVPAKATV